MKPEYKGKRDILTGKTAICKVCARTATHKVSLTDYSPHSYHYRCEKHIAINRKRFHVFLLPEYVTHLKRMERWNQAQNQHNQQTLI